MQISAKPPATTSPTPAPSAPASVTTVGPDGKTTTLAIPNTRAAVRELLAQREELSNQLSSVSDRRSELASEANNTPDAALRSGLEERLRLLDRRILQLETDLATTGQQLSAAPSQLRATTESANASDGGPDSFEDGLAVGGTIALFVAVAVLFFARRRWRRRDTPLTSQLGNEAAQRLERLEHGMEAIAIEIERVSEGQRFVTRLLSQSQPALEASHQIVQPESAGRGLAKQ